MAPLRGDRFCFTHAASAARLRGAARRKGGRRRGAARATVPAPVATVAELQLHLGLALADLRSGAITERRANAIARLVLAARRLIEDGETHEMLERIEDVLHQRGGGRP